MRFYIIDDLRGLAILNMILYHAMFDLVYIFGISIPFFTGQLGFIWEQYICFSFILISGFCQYFAKKSLIDGLKISLAGVVVSIVTIFANLGIEIYFGVLTFIGLAILVTIPFKKVLKKIDPVIGLIIFLSLFLIFRNINQGYLGFGPFDFYRLPDEFYSNWFTTLIGFPFYGFHSSDYFSFIPWYFLFLIGFYIYGITEKYNLKKIWIGKEIPFFTFISKHSLLIYLLHQPIIFGILYLLIR